MIDYVAHNFGVFSWNLEVAKLTYILFLIHTQQMCIPK